MQQNQNKNQISLIGKATTGKVKLHSRPSVLAFPVNNKEKQKEWYLKNKDRISQKGREYYLVNREAIIRKTTAHNKKVGKEVRRKYQVKYYTNNPDKKKIHTYLSRTYKLGIRLSYEEYIGLLNKQNNLCAICELPEKNGKNLAIDHCHKTGKLRELLCRNCNTALGFLNDNIEILKKAIKYLKKHEK